MTPPAPLLLKLVAAHLAGDYLLQGGRVATEKHRAGLLALHALVHGVLLALVALSEPAGARPWLPLAALLVAHAAIDAWTSRLAPRDLRLLALDQSLHAASIAGAAALARPAEIAALLGVLGDAFAHAPVYVLGAGFIAAVWAGGVVVGRVVEPFARHLGEQRPGLARAGRTIGLLERAIVFVAVLLRADALVGFVVAAKAILRLPEIREPGQRELAEYVLVGTLASVFWALLTGVLTRWALQGRP